MPTKSEICNFDEKIERIKFKVNKLSKEYALWLEPIIVKGHN